MKELINNTLKFLGGLVKRNFGWKLCSVVLAVVCWFVVMNIINPTEEKVYSVAVTLMNEDKLTDNNIVILNREDLLNSKVSIRVRAARSDLDVLDKKENREKIKATVDLNQFSLLYPENISNAVYVSVVPDLMQDKSVYQIVSFTPISIGVNLDNYVTVTKDVIVNTSGSTAVGYLSTEPVCEPSQVEISGPSSVIDNIENVCVNFDYNNASSDIQQELVPAAYDAEGNQISDVTFNVSSVTLKASVSHRGTVNITEPHILGEPADGYVVSDITYSPKVIEVIGDEDDVEALKEIKISDFDVSGSTGSRTFKYDISNYLKNYGLQPKNSSDTTITVTVKIEKSSTKTVNFESSDVTLIGKNTELYSYFVVQESPMKISGRLEDINSADVEKMTALCDVSELGAGVHSVSATVSVSSKSKVKVDEYPVFTVTVTAKKQITEIDENDENSDSAEVSETTEIISDEEETEAQNTDTQ